ncbi:MAG: metal-dependent hydrolase [Chloroflexi bacterium]|nr:metal-dependent hydrolase [Chloroflexota bacterium]
MYPLGHVTFACGAVWLGARLLDRVRRGETAQQPVAASAARATPREDATQRSSIADAVDYRLVALGALLPDLIDKPIVWVLFPNPDAGGHHIGHSLFVGLALLLPGLYLLAWRGKAGLALVGAAHLSHVFSDSVTHVPRSLLWPFISLDIPWNGILLRSSNIGAEVLAFAVLLFALRALRTQGHLKRLLYEGRL